MRLKQQNQQRDDFFQIMRLSKLKLARHNLWY